MIPAPMFTVLRGDAEPAQTRLFEQASGAETAWHKGEGGSMMLGKPLGSVAGQGDPRNPEGEPMIQQPGDRQATLQGPRISVYSS